MRNFRISGWGEYPTIKHSWVAPWQGGSGTAQPGNARPCQNRQWHHRAGKVHMAPGFPPPWPGNARPIHFMTAGVWSLGLGIGSCNRESQECRGAAPHSELQGGLGAARIPNFEQISFFTKSLSVCGSLSQSGTHTFLGLPLPKVVIFGGQTTMDDSHFADPLHFGVIQQENVTSAGRSNETLPGVSNPTGLQ